MLNINWVYCFLVELSGTLPHQFMRDVKFGSIDMLLQNHSLSLTTTDSPAIRHVCY